MVPVPSARRAVRRRGRDATAEVARAAAGELRARGMPARAAPVLRRRPGTADQGALGPVARRRNLRGAMRMSRAVSGARVLLIDDVITTGASLREAHRVLAEAGALVEGAVVLTSARERRPSGRTSGRPKPSRLIP